MKKLFLLLFVLHFVSYGQKADGLEICFEVQKSLKGFAADKEADDALDEILAVIGAAKNFYLIPCNEINNALALTYKGERFILYDKDFIDRINKATNDWSGKFILAHEVGHHINGHTRDFLIASVLDDQTKEKQREEELEADEFAGFIVAKLGAKYNQIKELINTIAPEKDDKYSTHPNRSKRLEAIKKGFDKVQVVDSKTKPNLIKENKIGSSSSWTYVNFNPYEDAIKFEKNFFNKNLGPFELKKFKDLARIGKKSISIGKSVKGDETCKIIITQKKYNKLGGIYNEFLKQYLLKKNAQKIMPFLQITVSIEDLYDFPKFRNRRYATKVEIPNYFDSKEFTGDTGFIVQRVDVLIDDIYEGSFPVEFKGYDAKKTTDYLGKEAQDEFRRKMNKAKLEKRTDRIFVSRDFGEHLIVPSTVEWSVYYDDSPEELYSLKNFIEALKKGKKLYLKLSNEFMNLEINSPKFGDWYPDYSFKSHTYEFDLSGSSKALQLD